MMIKSDNNDNKIWKVIQHFVYTKEIIVVETVGIMLIVFVF